MFEGFRRRRRVLGILALVVRCFAVLAVLTLLVSGCGVFSSNGPDKAAEAFLTAWSAGDVPAAAAQTDDPKSAADLLAAIRARGYRFITLADATADPAYQMDDTYTGALGTSWIFRWAKTQGRPDTFYFGEPQTPRWVVDLAGVSLPVE